MELYFTLFISLSFWVVMVVVVSNVFCFMAQGVWIKLHKSFSDWHMIIKITHIWSEGPGKKFFLFTVAAAWWNFFSGQCGLALFVGFVSFCHWFYKMNLFMCEFLLWPNRKPLTPDVRWWWETRWLTLVGGSSLREWWTSESWTNRPRSSTTSSKIPAF